LYQFHHIDRAAPWDEIWQAVDVAITAGKILYAGSSNFAGWHLARAQEAAKRRNLIGLSSEQSPYNLIDRDIELEVIPAAEHYGLGVIPWSPCSADYWAGCCDRGGQAFADRGLRELRCRTRPRARRCRTGRLLPPARGHRPRRRTPRT
jgi:aryl-alcohol dehydrogenase-like predicted oxidoreductase